MRRLLIFVCGFGAGIGLLVYFFGGIQFQICLISACLMLPLFFFRKTWLRRVAVFLLGMTLGLLWCSVYTAVRILPLQEVCGEEITVSAVAEDASRRTAHGSCVTARIEVQDRGVPVNLYYRGDTRVLPGDLLSVTTKLGPAAEDADFYDISRGILLFGDAGDTLAVEGNAPLNLRHRLALFSLELQEKLNAVFPEDSAAYYVALVTGDRSKLSHKVAGDLKVSGLYHAVSLSGMHVSILVSVVLFFCMGRKRLAVVFGIPLLILFCLMSGAQPATVRAVCMQSVLLFGALFQREYDSPTALSFALLLLLLQNPWSLTHWGLQLSFASTAGVLLLMPGFSRLPVKSKLLRRILQPVFVSLSVSVTSAPLASVYFGMNSLVAPLTNLLALWAVTLSFLGGIVTALCAFVFFPAAQILAQILDLLYRWVAWVADIFSSRPHAAVYTQTPLLLAWSYFAAVLAVVTILRRVKWHLPVVCIAVTMAAAFCFTPAQPEGITALDVGQGQCIVLRRDDHAVMVDCGGDGGTGELAAGFLLSNGIARLDALVLTHSDDDHCGSAMQLLSRVPADVVYAPGGQAPPGIPAERVENVTTLALSDMKLTLYPALNGKNDNDTGVCVLASCGECDILITGDLSAAGEARLTAAYELPDLDVLVAGHHGSNDSTGLAILDRLRPETVLISVGENTFGHPHQQVLDRIAASGAVAYTTRENGNLTVRW